MAGSLELGSLTALRLTASGLTGSGPQAHLCSVPPFPSGGDDWASGGAIHHVFTQPFAGDEHPPGMPAPSLSFCFARRSTPNPNKTICIRIRSSHSRLPTNFDFVCKNYRVYMCTRMSYAGSTPDLRVLGQGRLTVCIFCQMSQWLVLQWQSV